MIKSTGEFSIEAWMAPANVVQEDAYAVSYSGGTMARNVTLGQRAYQYEALTRTSETGRQRRAVAAHAATRIATRRRPCSTSCSPSIRSTAAASM